MLGEIFAREDERAGGPPVRRPERKGRKRARARAVASVRAVRSGRVSGSRGCLIEGDIGQDCLSGGQGAVLGCRSSSPAWRRFLPMSLQTRRSRTPLGDTGG